MSRFFRQDNAFLRIMAVVFDLIELNVLTVVTCLPVVTAGASLTAMHGVLWRMVRHEEGYVSQEFLRSFRMNFRQSTQGWLVMLGVCVVLAGDVLAVVESGISGWPRALAMSVLIVLGFALAAVGQYFFVLVSRYENSLRGQFRNAAVLAVRNLPRTVAMLVVLTVSGVAMVRYLVYAVPLVVLLGVTLPQYVCAWLYDPILRRLDAASAEDGGSV